jgi:hypothetical protein
MTIYHYTFTYKNHTVTIRITARNKHVANKVARQRELTWRAAIDARLKEQAS